MFGALVLMSRGSTLTSESVPGMAPMKNLREFRTISSGLDLWPR